MCSKFSLVLNLLDMNLFQWLQGRLRFWQGCTQQKQVVILASTCHAGAEDAGAEGEEGEEGMHEEAKWRVGGSWPPSIAV